MKISIVLLLASLLVALGPWIISLPSWSQALTPSNFGALAGIIGGVVLAWFGKSPIKTNGIQTK